MNTLMNFPFEHAHRPWWGFLSWLVPLVLVAVVVGLVVWLVLRGTGPAGAAGRSVIAAGPPVPDPALEAARMRYARGEIGRDDFLRLSADLGGHVNEPVPPPPPDARGGPAEGEGSE